MSAMTRKCYMPVLILVLMAVVPFSFVRGESHEGINDHDLITALQNGGYNIYFRHAPTDWTQSDNIENPGDWESCDPTRFRQLSDQGRDISIGIGDAIRTLKIPIGKVFASPYCRAMETARLLNIGPVEATTDVMNLRASEYFNGREAIVQRARIRLSEKPLTGKNTVFVAHGNVAREATPVYPGEAEAVVFQPIENGKFELIGRISPQRWKKLVAIFSSTQSE